MGRCKAPGCKTETPLKDWAALNGLAARPEESVREHAIRCWEFISGTDEALAAPLEAAVPPESGLSVQRDETPPEVLDWLSSVPRLPQEDRDDDIPQV